MKKNAIALFILLMISAPAFAQYYHNPYETYEIRANDGTYLGNTANKYDPDSIYNQYGQYGSKYSPDSINNQYGQYGSPYSLTSPNNKYAEPARAYPQNGNYYYNYGGRGY